MLGVVTISYFFWLRKLSRLGWDSINFNCPSLSLSQQDIKFVKVHSNDFLFWLVCYRCLIDIIIMYSEVHTRLRHINIELLLLLQTDFIASIISIKEQLENCIKNI